MFPAPATSKNRDKYWAAESGDELAALCMDKVKRYREALKKSILWQRMIRADRNWHGLQDMHSGEASTLGRRGSKGHRAAVRSSTAAIDAQHQLALIMPIIPSLDAVPVNTAYRTLAQVPEAKRFFNYFVEHRGLGQQFYKAVTYGQKLGTGYLVTDWDPFAGTLLEKPEPWDANDVSRGLRKFQGEPKYRAHNALDCILDLFNDGNADWCITRDKVNRWKLVDDYPELADDIKQAAGVLSDDEWMQGNFRFDVQSRDDDLTDLIPVFTLHHRRAGPMPQGKMFRFLDDRIWLFEKGYPYEALHLAIYRPRDIWNYALGDSTFHMALGPQAAMDRILSTSLTNVLALGHQFVHVNGENFEIKELSDGVSLLAAPTPPGGEPPRAITLLGPQGESLNLADKMEGYIHACSAVNSVIRGQPDENIESGSFAGLLVQQAQQYNSPGQYSAARMVEKVANDLLECLKLFADQPVLAEISGPNNTWRMKLFKQDDFNLIHRLYARQGDPSQNSPAFVKSQADMLLQEGMIESKEEYLAMTRSNTTELNNENKDAEELLVVLENETMQAAADGRQLEPFMVLQPLPPGMAKQVGLPGMGPDTDYDTPPMDLDALLSPGAPARPQWQLQVPPVLETHNDVFHIRKHADLANSPAATSNPKLMQLLHAHIAWHVVNMKTKDPELAQVLGQPVAPPPMAEAGTAGGGASAAPPPRGKPRGANGASKGPNGVQAVRSVRVPAEGQIPAGAGA